MTPVRFSAPGKILLCGEYVVLDGAPSLCMAINRRATVTIQEREKNENAVRSPGFADERFLFSIDKSGKFEWHTRGRSRPDFSLLEKVWVAISPALSSSVDLVLDTRAFSDPAHRKMGLGGSAALTVALSAAIASLQHGTLDVDRMIESHREFQNGRGSGADVAAAFSGGLIEYQIGDPAMICPMKWAGDLEYAVLWSGHSVSTTEKLSQFAGSNKAGYVRQALADASAAIVSAWSGSDAEHIMSLFASYTEILAEFSSALDLGIFDGGHAELLDLASECGVVYKPCGAGGGDVGIVIAANKEAIGRFAKGAALRNFFDLDLIIDENGLTAGDKNS